MDFFISDTHFSHDKDFIYAKRGFKNIQEHDETILRRINEVVGVEDNLYILGDVCMGDTDKSIKYVQRIVCQNIHIIRGNHDSEKRMDYYNDCRNVIEISEGKYHRIGKWSFFLSHFPSMTANFDDNQKSLRRRMWNLCGHVHTDNKFLHIDNGSYHVDVEAHNGYPVSAEEIKADIHKFFKIDC